MKITKFGHSCLLVEDSGTKVLLDPGKYSRGQDLVKELDAVLLTHEHYDHLDKASLKVILDNNPDVKVFCGQIVGKVLEQEGVSYIPVANGQVMKVKDLSIAVRETPHAIIHPSIPQTSNTSYLIGERLFCPGDALELPSFPIEILALPVAGPWLKLSEAIDFASSINPKTCFPIHDGMLSSFGSTYIVPPKVLEPLGTVWRILEEGIPAEF